MPKFGGCTNGVSRTISVLAPSAISGIKFDHAHLQPSANLNLVSHDKSLELYRHNARKLQDLQTGYELAVFILEAAQVQRDIAIEEDRALVSEALNLLREVPDRGHVIAQSYLAECLAAGIGHSNGKPQVEVEEAQGMLVQAAKHGHADVAYKAGLCYENGWKCLHDSRRTIEWLRNACSQGHPGALCSLSMTEINSELGRKSNVRSENKFRKLSAESATPD